MSTKKYDAVIIGAGIGGLVCGCYLAKAGKKVMIVEKSAHYGGYCMSFPLKGFVFDACVHSIGSCRKGGFVTKVLDELGLISHLEIKRYAPSDLVILDDKHVYFGDNVNDLIKTLQSYFPDEYSAIDSFFSFITNTDDRKLFIKLKHICFRDFLDEYFKDRYLKAILSVPILGNAGLPPSVINSYFAVILLREFMLDGGYYIGDSIQSFSDAIAQQATEYGCHLSKRVSVQKILIKKDKVAGVSLSNGSTIDAKDVIANCSVEHVFNNLLGEDGSSAFNKMTMSKFNPSLSAFTLFLGVKNSFKIKKEFGCNVWLSPGYDLDSMYNLIEEGKIEDDQVYLLMYLSEFFKKQDKKTICFFVNAPFKTKQYWKDRGQEITEKLIEKATKLIPGLGDNIVFQHYATPHTLFGYANNYNGAAYGWMQSVKQSWNVKVLRELSLVEGLHFVGHWTTQGFGIPGVMSLGRSVALRIVDNNFKVAK